MTDLNDDEVPAGFARFIGHICGVIFIGFLALAIWLLLALKMKFSVAGVTALAAVFGICWFFGSTAHKLTTGAKAALITPWGYRLLCASSILFGCLMALAAYDIAVSEDFSASQILLMSAGSLMCITFGYHLYQHHIRRRR